MADPLPEASGSDAAAVMFNPEVLRRRSTATSANEAQSTSGESIPEPDFSTIPTMAGTGKAPLEPRVQGDNTNGAMPHALEPDTCRICRGEGTSDEPLFYPCKCSGSIKYVHQDCLMEWLSHSQKKHCELCKTPFRFTKLYSPNMPSALPPFVFVHHMTQYFFRNLLIWLRGALVASVWLGVLPYLMRSVWSFLFWISDEGLGGGGASLLFSRGNHTLGSLDGNAFTANPSAAVCPASPLFAETTTAASMGGLLPSFSLQAMPTFIRGIYARNLTSADSIYFHVLRLLFGSAPSHESSSAASNTTTSQNFTLTLGVPGPKQTGSLLSEVGFLKHLTRSSTTNKVVIQILEGQIITVLVIVSFILIILVRDYVVQQQPEIDGAAEAEQPGNRAVEVHDINAGEQPAEQQVRLEASQEQGEENHDQGWEEEETLAGPASDARDAEELGSAADGLEDAAMADTDEAPRESSSTPADAPSAAVFTFGDHTTAATTGGPSPPRFEMTSSLPLPTAESRRANGSTDSRTHNRRAQGNARLPQFNVPEDGTTINEYLAIYREAEGRPERILEIVQERGLDEKLQYWIRLTKTRRERERTQQQTAPSSSGANGDEVGSQSASATLDGDGSESRHHAVNGPPHAQLPREEAEESPVDPPGWSWPSSQPTQTTPALAQGKGKQRATEESQAVGPGESQGSAPPFASGLGHGHISPTPIEPLTAAPSASFGEPLRRQPISNASSSDNAVATPSHSESAPSIVSRPDEVPRPTPDRASAQIDPDDSHSGQQETSLPSAQVDQRETVLLPLPPFPEADRIVEAAAPRQPATLLGRLADFMWQDVDALPHDELEALQDVEAFDGDDDDDDVDDDIDAGAPDVEAEDVRIPAAGAAVAADAHRDAAAAEDERQIAEAFAAAGFDADAIDDAEDFEGIMELVGMRGPITGLFQNAIFCAFLVSVTIFLGIFLPYNIGRIAVWMVANPARPARMLFSVSRFLQDIAVAILATLLSWCYAGASFATGLVRSPPPLDPLAPAAVVLRTMSANARQRLAEGFTSENPFISTTEMRNFSALSHEALLTVKEHVYVALSLVGQAFAFVVGGNYSAKGRSLLGLAHVAYASVRAAISAAPSVLSNPDSWVIDLSLPETASIAKPELASWDGVDRFWAVVCGYLAFALTAGVYLRRGAPLSSSQTGQEWEAALVDALNQASGVLKVVVIIGIEMLVFPLYCGMLLDLALMPLFANTSMGSRVFFTVNFPLTSIFVHWFVGTGYMFHFALFVSMCRKIMRKGVLYFIRDPDDPEFHPVRDVLERNLTTQLRKIAFSAFVYGGLVVICLGGVVWSLALGLPGVLPIHYSSNEPVLEFPLDLLFYNFLMPLAIRTFRPSDGLHAMYTWWFRKCARGLRITWYLFGERRIDEEGELVLPTVSEYHDRPWWKKAFLELSTDAEDIHVRPKTWHDLFQDGKAKPTSTSPAEQMALEQVTKEMLVATQQLRPDGTFVRTPASDQVKIPKGMGVFLAVTELNQRIDGKMDDAAAPGADLYSSGSYQHVYIPPNFRLRIFAFILCIWAFAAVTGVSITIVPLVFGRWLFHLLVPTPIRTNDIYTFSIGIYILASVGHALLHAREMLGKVKRRVAAMADGVSQHSALRRTAALLRWCARLVYAYTAVYVVFPFLVASLMELYLLIPLNTYMYSALVTPTMVSPSSSSSSSSSTSSFGSLLPGNQSTASANVSALFQPGALQAMTLNPQHSVRVMQAWTIGILYLKLLSRIVTVWFPDTRAAAARRAVFRRGLLDPDVKLLTRAFVVPMLLVWALAVLVPLGLGRLAVGWGAGRVMIPAGMANTNTNSTTGDTSNSSSGGPRWDARLDPRYLEAGVVLVYRLSFPATMSFVLGTYIAWRVSGLFAFWKARIKDEAYLVGERLHNFHTGGWGVDAASRRGREWRGQHMQAL